MRAVWTVTLLALLTIAGCSSATTQPSTVVSSAQPASATASNPAAPAETVAFKPGIDACALLTSEEIKAVQGEEPKETKLAGQAGGGLSTSQCFFTLPTSGNSVSLVVVQKGAGADAKDPEEFWSEKFHEQQRADGDKDRDRAGDREKEKSEAEGEEEEGAAPERVSGVGKEAYWVGSRVGGALYVLKGNAYLRVSVGGPADQAGQIRKAKALAQEALARL